MRKEDLIGLKVKEVKAYLEKVGATYEKETKKKLTFKEKYGRVIKLEENKKTGKIIIYEAVNILVPIMILVTLVVAGLSLTYGNGIYRSIKEQIIEVEGAPVLETEEGWGKERLVRVVKDAKTSKRIIYYEYCVRKDKNEECTWEKTETKNARIGKTGIWEVIFRAVKEDEKRGRETSIKVYVDNNNPEISSFKVVKKEKNSIKVSVEARDEHSGIDKIMYSIDGIKYVEGEKDYTFKGLEAGKEYRIYVRVIDKVGNESTVSILVSTEKEESKEETKETKKEEKTKDKEKEEEWDIPKINLDKVPSVFKYGEKYELPSFYDFGNDTGEVVCLVDEEEYKDTSTLTVGKHVIVCTATSAHGKIAQVEKEIEVEVLDELEGIFDGWIKLKLHYPEGSTDWEWRLDGEDGIRTGYNGDNWQAYTGPILVKLEDTENVYIRYKINGETYIIAPRGKVVVDVEPEKWTLNSGETTKVKINWDSKAGTKKYRINGGSWQEYSGPFEVSANTLIEAKATKKEPVYDSEGEFQYNKTLTGQDTAYVSLYVEPGKTAPSGPGGIPLSPVGGGPSDPSNPGGPWVPTPGTPSPNALAGPIINSNPSSSIVEETEVTITTQEAAYKIYYKIGSGAYKEYTGPFTVRENCIIRAYYVSLSEGKTSLTSYYRVDNIL